MQMSTLSISPSTQRWTLAVTAFAAAAALIAQVAIAIDLLEPHPGFEAAHAKGVLAFNAALAIATVTGAAFLPERRRALALVPGALLAVTLLAGAVTVGGHAWDFALAPLTMLACWWTGRALMRMLGCQPLQRIAIVEVMVGLPILGLAILGLGHLGIIAWWSVGVPTIVLGILGARGAMRAAWRWRLSVWEAMAGSPLAVACTGLLLLQLTWLVVWISAPEIMFDALSGKAYLPELWASSGSVGTILSHPVLNFDAGLAELVAVPGHAVGADGVGRGLQLLSLCTLIVTVWWWAGPRSAAGPLAALVVGIAPQLVWQATTAYDDLVLALGATALSIAALRTLSETEREPTRGTAGTIGMLAGACIWLKLHLLVLPAVLLVAWVVLAESHGAPAGSPSACWSLSPASPCGGSRRGTRCSLPTTRSSGVRTTPRSTTPTTSRSGLARACGTFCGRRTRPSSIQS
jgi:hypothetical protein